jgi:hypothetical protein
MPTEGERMSTTAYAWAPITKVDDQPDGTVMVYGAATDASLDRDQQRMDQAWLDRAMPRWMAEGGNVREQHDKHRAIGVGVGLHKDEGSGAWMLTSHIVDPIAVLKVKTGVLKGYSIGVKDPHVTFGKADAPAGLIDGGSVCEVSAADRPSNPGTYFTLAKADAAGDLVEVEEPELVEGGDEAEEPAEGVQKFVNAASRKRMAGSGVAMPNGDFPIPDEGHLRSAIGHLGNYTGDKAAAKAHIVARARDLGLTSLLPDEWGIAKADQILAEITGLVPDLTKADDEGGDIATAQQAIALIGKLIASEAASMAGGQLGEDGDISCLLDAVRALKYFITCEEQEMEPNPDLTTEADSLDLDGDTYVTAKTDTPDTTKVDTGGLADIVKAAVAEATATLRDELTLVKADLVKVAAMPVAGGPVAMRTASQTQAARDADASHLRAQAKDLLAKAESVRGDDPTASRGYRERAAELLSKADA